jgi:hypothetical protein
MSDLVPLRLIMQAQALAACVAERHTRDPEAGHPVAGLAPDHVEQDVAVALLALIGGELSVEGEALQVNVVVAHLEHAG